jgi:hypothetical protein
MLGTDNAIMLPPNQYAHNASIRQNDVTKVTSYGDSEWREHGYTDVKIAQTGKRDSRVDIQADEEHDDEYICTEAVKVKDEVRFD